MERADMIQVLDALQHWKSAQPTKKAWIFLNDKGDPVDDYTYAELDNATSYLADYLVNTIGLKKGDRVLLVFFPSLDFTVSLLACFKAQLIAVPVFPPDPRKLKKDLHHFVAIQQSSDAKVALTNQQFNFVKKVEDIKNMFSGVRWPDLRWVPVDEQLKKGKTVVSVRLAPPPPMDTVAFLQYTSGSTSEPKGVMISHRNLAHNLTLITRELRADTSTVNVSWLPQYHDMGLIGSYLGVLYCGGRGYYLSPISFLKDPVVWLRAISRYSGTHTQAPNFAFALVSRKFSEHVASSPAARDPLDLSSLRHMINAAEPVDFKAILDFYHTFEPYRLKSNVVVPTFGLAEHTVFVSSGGELVLTVDKHALVDRRRVEVVQEEVLVYNSMLHSAAHSRALSNQHIRVVGCGAPSRGEGVTAVIAVDAKAAGGDEELPGAAPAGAEAMRAAAELEVGEIWLDSQSKALGYWQQPELSEHDFRAALLDPQYEGQRFLRTGDMGFLYKGELFICGRSKDMIITGGANHYPQDLERTVEQGVDSLRAGCCAVIAISTSQLVDAAGGAGLLRGLTSRDGGEVVVLVAELKDDVPAAEHSRIAQNCVALVSAEHGLSLRFVFLIPSRSIPKTTSGKIARSWVRRALLDGTLKLLFEYDNPHAKVGASGAGGRSGGGEGPEVKTGRDDGETQLKADGSAGVGYSALPQRDPGVAALPLEDVRGMDHPQLVFRLEGALKHILGTADDGKCIDEHQPLAALGVDSMSIVQFKGLLENRFYCELPDEFMFSAQCNLHQLAVAVHEGKLTPEQQRLFLGEQGGASAGGVPGRAAGTAEVVGALPRQPLCPWFTCCY